MDEKWNKKMGGRSCFITCGAFGDTLLCSAVNIVLIIVLHHLGVMLVAKELLLIITQHTLFSITCVCICDKNSSCCIVMPY